MTILVLSDSHAAKSFMRLCVERVNPDAIVHLGDYFEDGKVIQEENPGITFYQVPGNCDKYRVSPEEPVIRIPSIFGVDIYMTHGHLHQVKSTTDRLLRDVREARAQAVLYGHTHVPNCYQEPDGLWVLNPGSCGYYGGSAGLMEVENKKITACRILRQADLEDMT